MKVSLANRVYDVLKFIALVGLPALTSLYFALSGIWHFPATEQVIGTLTVVDTFLGGILGLSAKGYSPPTDGHVIVDDSHPDVLGMSMKFTTPQAEMASKKSITLKVTPGPLPAPPIPGPHGGD